MRQANIKRRLPLSSPTIAPVISTQDGSEFVFQISKDGPDKIRGMGSVDFVFFAQDESLG